MAVINLYYITRNGYPDWGNCNAALTDTLRCEALIYFSGLEVGKYYKVIFKLRVPSGLVIDLFSYLIVSNGTNTFISQTSIPINQYGSGTYFLTGIVYGVV